MSEVRIIKPVANYSILEGHTIDIPKKKVAAYCRVSTDNEEQQTSYKYQIDEYTKKINANPDWELVDIYSDEGISGTSAKHRVGFNRMIADATSGKIDIIITKSVSRFARNTELVLTTLRILKESNVQVIFEKEGFDSFDPKCNVVLTMLSSIAQEEARNTSENVRWTYKKKMSEGKVIVNHNRFLGYTKDENGNLVIVPEEAEIVKLIFNLYANNIGSCEIQKILERKGLKTGAGKTKWHLTTIQGILRNEKYCGDLLLQKTVTTDYLTHNRVRNNQLAPMYFKENAHEAIIDRETFDKVQLLIKQRRECKIGKNTNVSKYNSRYPFSGFIMCYNCGRYTKRRYWNYGTPAEKVVQICGNYLTGKGNCPAKGVSDKLLQETTLYIINNYFLKNTNVFKVIKAAVNQTIKVDETTSLILEKENQKAELDNQLGELIDMKLQKKFSEELIEEKYIKIKSELEIVLKELEILRIRQCSNQDIQNRVKDINKFIDSQEQELTELTAHIVQSFFYKMIVKDRDEVIFCIASSKAYSDDEFKEKRKDFADKLAPIICGTYSNDKDSIKYKVVII